MKLGNKRDHLENSQDVSSLNYLHGEETTRRCKNQRPYSITSCWREKINKSFFLT